MGLNRKTKRALARAMVRTTSNIGANGLDISEICRRLNFLEQMRPEKRNKPRNIKKADILRAALVKA